MAGIWIKRTTMAVGVGVFLLWASEVAVNWATGYSYQVVSRADVEGPSGSAVDGVVAPLAGFDFDHGDWAAYILLDNVDFRRLRDHFRRNCLKLSDRDALKKLASDFRFDKTGGDMATIVSKFVLVRDGEVVFSSGILLHPSGGLQSGWFGWAPEQRRGMLLSHAKRFDPIASPIVIVP